MRYWVELTYTYCVGEYRSGKHVHHFRREEEADEFVRQVKDKHVQVHYEASNPDKSVILDRDLEVTALLAPQYR
jgi:superfamily I DNA and RNA helicase